MLDHVLAPQLCSYHGGTVQLLTTCKLNKSDHCMLVCPVECIERRGVCVTGTTVAHVSFG